MLRYISLALRNLYQRKTLKRRKAMLMRGFKLSAYPLKNVPNI